MSVTIGDLKFFTVAEIAEAFGIQERAIRGYISSGKLTGAKMGTRYFVSEEAIAAYFRPEPENEPEPEHEEVKLSAEQGRLFSEHLATKIEAERDTAK